MMAGGGPAGMEAAIIAAQRGHHVTLYEKDDRLGGRFREAAQVPYKEEFADLIRYQQVQLQRTGVEVHLNTRVTPEMVEAEDPDAVVVATGARPIVPPFPGLEKTRWMTAYDLLDGRAEVSTPTAFIVGAGTAGMETAEYLARAGYGASWSNAGLKSVGGWIRWRGPSFCAGWNPLAWKCAPAWGWSASRPTRRDRPPSSPGPGPIRRGLPNFASWPRQ
jgi:NADPH-dependent 2,4-dienoyl-CoA reductase/sulfur reductase-like enzyme